MKTIPDVCSKIHHRLIVSCQALEGEPFCKNGAMVPFALAAVLGGAAGIRANGTSDIRSIRAAVNVPIIGISKRKHHDGRPLITGSTEEARELVKAGADIIALDCTHRGQDCGALERIGRIKSELHVPVFADIATVEEAVAAAQAGADAVLSTMRGYTEPTAHVRAFEASFIAELSRTVNIPVIAEGRIETPEQAAAALAAGAFAVIVGTAITRPREITRRFACALEAFRGAHHKSYVLGIDLGGTMTKSGLVRGDGQLVWSSCRSTPATGGRRALLEHLKETALQGREAAAAASCRPAALGIATAGWVDPFAGRVVYATENLPGWTGTPVAEELERSIDLPTAVENDANALAVAERQFGLGRGVDNFVCITLGTGVGGGCYIGGRLNRGGHFFANALGHVSIEADGLPCTCGGRDCLEVYANAAALIRYTQGEFESAEDVIRAANMGSGSARRATLIFAERLAQGCVSIINLLDPELLVFSGGLAQDNQFLIPDLQRHLEAQVPAWNQRNLRIKISGLGYFGGVLGAGAVALEKVNPYPRTS